MLASAALPPLLCVSEDFPSSLEDAAKSAGLEAAALAAAAPCSVAGDADVDGALLAGTAAAAIEALCCALRRPSTAASFLACAPK